MHYKIQGAVRRNKRNFIIFILLWILLSIVFVMPIAVAIKEATIDGVFNLGRCLSISFDCFANMGKSIGKTFTADYVVLH